MTICDVLRKQISYWQGHAAFSDKQDWITSRAQYN